MRRENRNNQKRESRSVRARSSARLRLDDDDDTLTEVGEEPDFGIFEEMDSDDRRHDPLRLPH